MSDNILVWAGVLIPIVAVYYAARSYRSQRSSRELEYIVLSNAKVLDKPISKLLSVTYLDQAVEHPSVAVMRIVNTGNKSILPSEIDAPMAIILAGGRIVACAVTCAKPAGLNVTPTIEGNRIVLARTLINPEDLIELQILTSGRPTDITFQARISDLEPKRRYSLPYPPGSGGEGEMTGADRFVWWGMTYVLFLLLIVLLAISIPSLVLRIGLPLTVLVVAVFVYPQHVRKLVRRRRIWSPDR